MCCGRQKQQIPNFPATVRVASGIPPAASAPFVYTGKTAMTVVSPLTGKQYRFARTGARVEVDLRDRSWIAVVPHLRRVG